MNAIVRKPRVIERDPEYLDVASRAPGALLRRLEAELKEAASPLRGFPLGRMKINGDFGKDAQAKFEAADWFHELYARYRRVIGVKGISPQNIEGGSKGQAPDPDSERGQIISRAEKRLMRQFESARLSALACGVDDYACFIAVVIQEQEPNWAMKCSVVKVAEALRKHRAAASRHRAGRRA